MAFKLDETKKNIEIFLEKLEKKEIKPLIATSWDPVGRPLKFHTNSYFHKNITFFKRKD
jgi:hypothetical protein